ncbi:MAG: S8 family serine peptidase [Hyphomicrobiales bacterium]|nr:S8 family serine peptidase [Hyphomicrobiales bacterium]
MPHLGGHQPKRERRAAALALFAAVAVSVGVGLSDSASAIDLPEQLRNAVKNAPAAKGTPPAKGAPAPKALPKGALIKGLPAGVALPKGVSLPPGVALPKGVSLPPGAANAALPKGPALPNGAVLPKGPTTTGALPKSANLPNTAGLPKGTNLPSTAGLPKGASLPKGATLPNTAALPKGVALPKGAALPGGLAKGAPAGIGLGRGTPFGRGAMPPAIAARPAAGLLTAPRRDLSALSALDFRRLHVAHQASVQLARSLLPVRPLPGQRGFTGVPPAGETRFVSNEMMFHIGANVPQTRIDAVARRLGLSAVASQSSDLTGGTLVHFRLADGRQVAEVVRALEAENIGAAAPNYVYTTVQDESLAARTATGNPDQYVIGKLNLGEVHRVATGSNVLVAVVDSQVDVAHPDLVEAIVEEFDAVGRREQPHAHGTGMTGAIAARRQLMGVAPGTRILAVHAFSTEARETAQATTRHILAGLDYAIKKGARVINMSFAGPYDPMLALALKNAREKGVVLIAAAGNAGPRSPPLYPAADPNVIAVTATDRDDNPFGQANQGPYVAVAAPGVDILEPAPGNTYQVTTGTSVAAAHVSGVAALLLERNPALDGAAVHEILTMSARKAGASGRDDKLGWGLVDPAQALLDLDARVAREQSAPQANVVTPPAAKPVAASPITANPAAKPVTRSVAPKPAAAVP